MSWPVVKLGDICTTTQGVQITKANTKEEPYQGGYRYLYIADFMSEKKLSFVDDEFDHKKVTTNDLVMANTGSPGRVFKGKDGILSNNLFKISFDNNSVDRDYLYMMLSSNVFQSLLQKQMKGGIQKHLGHQTISRQEIPLPPLDEQKRIAAILDKADAIRRKRQQAIQLADDFLRSVFLDMFGSDLQRSTNVTTFGDVSILDAKMVDPCEEEYLDLLHIGPDRIEKSTGKLLPALTAREEQLISKKFLFDNQYILYSKIRPYLRKVAVPDFKALCSADMYPIKPVKGKVTREFMWMLLLSDYFDNYVSSLPARANIPKLNRIELAAFEFSLPDFSKIEKFTAVVKKSHQDTKRINSSYVESINLFNALSQKAFAGEL